MRRPATSPAHGSERPAAPGRKALRVVLVAGPLLLLVAVLVGMTVGDKPLLGTNRVGPAAFFAVVPPGGKVCTGDPQRIPAGTGEVGVRTSTDQTGSIGVALLRGGRTIASGQRSGGYAAGDVAVPLSRSVPVTQQAVVCVRNAAAKPLGLAGSPANQSPRVRIDGRPVDALIRLEYRSGTRASWWSRIGKVMDNFSVGKASWVGGWTLWLAVGLVLAAIVVALVLLWRMGRGPPRWAALACALVAVLNALAWSITVPPFQVPDEESHTGYVQYLAETGKVPKPGSIGYSAEETGVLNALQFGSVVGVRNNHPPHGPEVDAQLRALERGHASRVGGGDPAGAVIYPPTFYALESIPYALSPTGDGLLDRLSWMRALSAVLAGFTVLLSFGFLRELLPRTPWAWTSGALALAFFPMFGFVSGGVQNDAGLYVCAAALFWAMARVLRSGLTPVRGLWLGGALVAGLLIKFTMVGLAPAAVLAVVVALWRARAARRSAAAAADEPLPSAGAAAEESVPSAGADERLPSAAAADERLPSGAAVADKPLPWRGALTAAAVVAVPLAVYAALSSWVWGRQLTGPLRASHPEVASPDPATIAGQLSYAWQLVLPRLPFMDDKFLGFFPPWDTWFRGGIGRFGWLDYGFPEWVAIALVPVAVALVALAVRAVVSARARVGDLAVYAVAVLGLFGLLAVVGYRYELKYETYFQSPRYLFALLPLGAAIIAAACRGAGRRWGPAVGAAAVVIAMALTVFAQLATLERYYS